MALIYEGAPADPHQAHADRVGVGTGGLRVRVIRTRTQQDHVRFLRAMVNESRGDQLIRDKALDIVFRQGGAAPGDKREQALLIGEWAQSRLTYVNEGTETFQTPRRTLTFRYGDCDDFSTMIGALLESLGIRSQMVAVAWRGQFRHIFPRALVPRRDGRGEEWIPLDATLLKHPIRRLTDPLEIARRKGETPTVFAL